MVQVSEQRRTREMAETEEMAADDLVEYELSGKAVNDAVADIRHGRSKQ
jgi:hypothetical protein